MSVLATLSGLVLRRRGRVILGPVDCALSDAGTTIVMGPNGAGKTSFLRALHGIERINAGRINWSDPENGAGQNQSFVFQTPILMRRTVEDCIAYPLRLQGASKADARAAANECAAAVGLQVDLGQSAAFLSGGEQQKMALARALIRRPRLLFLDEPCANLDGRSIKEIEDVLHRIRSGGTRIIMSTHDIGQARRLADNVLFLHAGRLLEQSEGQRFFDAPTTPEAAAYLKGEILL